MRIDIQKLQEDYKQRKPMQGIEPEKVSEYMKELYGVSELEDASAPYDTNKMQEQVDILCTTMEEIGLENFGSLRNKFKAKPSASDIANIRLIKETMEAIVYQAKNGTLSEKDISTQFADRDFICNEGTLTNLQGILSDMTLGTQDLAAFVVEQKDKMVTQILTEMYRNGDFSEFSWILRQYKPMEIHNVTSLKNSVADQYGLLKKSKEEDKHISNIYESSKNKALDNLFDKINTPELSETFIDGIAMDITLNLPHFEEGMNKDNYANDLMDKLANLGLGMGDKAPEEGAVFLENGSVLQYNEYQVQGPKQNLNEIIKDAIIVKLSEKGLVQHPDIEKVKVRLALETSMDIGGNNAIGEEVIQSSEEKGLKEYAFKYAIDQGLKLDADDFNDISDPLEYCIKNDITIDSKSARHYVLEKITDQYLKTENSEVKADLEKRYNEVQNIGESKEVELLTLDSDIGKLISREDAPKLLAEFQHVAHEGIENQIDYTKCDLKFIEQCSKVVEKSSMHKVRDYSKFSTLQKVTTAVTMVLAAVGAAVAYFFEKGNERKRVEMENKVVTTFASIEDDLKKVSLQDKVVSQSIHSKDNPSAKDIASEIGKKVASHNKINHKHADNEAPHKKNSPGISR